MSMQSDTDEEYQDELRKIKRDKQIERDQADRSCNPLAFKPIGYDENGYPIWYGKEM